MGQSATKEAAHERNGQRRRRRERTCLIVSCPTFALHLLTDFHAKMPKSFSIFLSSRSSRTSLLLSPSDISVRRVRVICCSIQVLQQPGVNTVAASHPLRLLLLLLLLLLTMCKTGLWKERNSSDKNVTHHPKKRGGRAERNAS
jgi:DNA-binding transcriptional LysR family regulator